MEEMFVERDRGASLPEIEHGSHVVLNGHRQLLLYTSSHRMADWVMADNTNGLYLLLQDSPTEAELMEWVIALLERQGLNEEFYPELRTGTAHGRVDLKKYNP